MLQDFSSVSKHFVTLCIKELKLLTISTKSSILDICISSKKPSKVQPTMILTIVNMISDYS